VIDNLHGGCPRQVYFVQGALGDSSERRPFSFTALIQQSQGSEELDSLARARDALWQMHVHDFFVIVNFDQYSSVTRSDRLAVVAYDDATGTDV
jgi:hypothetical protein